jgi:hypothetical protein
MYGIFGWEITKCTVIYGVYVRFWPTLHIPVKACRIHSPGGSSASDLKDDWLLVGPMPVSGCFHSAMHTVLVFTGHLLSDQAFTKIPDFLPVKCTLFWLSNVTYVKITAFTKVSIWLSLKAHRSHLCRSPTSKLRPSPSHQCSCR